MRERIIETAIESLGSEGLIIDLKVYHSFSLNYLLIGMAYSATVVNLISEEKAEQILSLYSPLLNLSLVVVIANLGMPLDYRLIAGAGVFTAVYIISRAVGKIGGAYLGGKITKAKPTVSVGYIRHYCCGSHYQ